MPTDDPFYIWLAGFLDGRGYFIPHGGFTQRGHNAAKED